MQQQRCGACLTNKAVRGDLSVLFHLASGSRPRQCLRAFRERTDLDFRKVGLGRVRLATEGEIVKLFPDTEVGAMPPFGELFNLPVYLDEGLAREKHVVFAAGTHRDAIHMRMDDYLGISEPMITRLACPEVTVK